MAKQITTSRALFKFLMRETKKLPEDAAKFYSKQIRYAVCYTFDIFNPQAMRPFCKNSFRAVDNFIHSKIKMVSKGISSGNGQVC